MTRDHSDMLPMIRQAFADHVMTRGPGLSWRMAKPGTGIYSFRVTWVPGAVIVTGDVGDAIYHTSSFGNLWSAIDLIRGADYDYLVGKSDAREVFDREATAESIIRRADEYLSDDEDRYWRMVADKYDWRGTLDVTNERHRKVLAIRLRDDIEMTAERACDLFGDFEQACYSHEPRTRWVYEALILWTAEMLRREPGWHRIWRRAQREWCSLKNLRRYPIRFRPAIHATRNGTWLNGSRTWIRDGARFKAVCPLVVLGCDLSRFGFWREQGSSMPDDDRMRGYFEGLPA